MRTVVAVHTAMPMVGPTKVLFEELLPNVRLINIVDDSLIQDVIAAGEVPPMARKRLLSYYQSAVDAGADVIFNTCSSVGDIALLAKELINIPLVKIDDSMALSAVRRAATIGILATLRTTLAPTRRLIEHFAVQEGKTIEVVEGLAEGAFEAVLRGDTATHDELIKQKALEIARQVDTIVLAQGSMARMESVLAEATQLRVYSSPRLGVLEVKEVLDAMG